MDKTNDWKWGDELDAVAVAPRSHIILLENENVRVLDIILAPKQKEPIHTHKWPSVMIIYSSTAIRYYDEQRQAIDYPGEEATHEKPFVEWLGPEGPHAVENLDEARAYHAIRVEWKK